MVIRIGGRHRSLAGWLTGAFRLIAATIVMTLLVASTCFGLVLFHFEPDVESLAAARDGVELSHDGMLDQETGVRGYLSTGDGSFLEPYTKGEAEVTAGDGHYASLAAAPALTGAVLDTRLAEQRWITGWAVPAATLVPASLTHADLADLLARGKSLFDAYRVTEGNLVGALNAQIADEQGSEHLAVAAGLVFSAFALVTLSILAHRQQRRLHEALLTPIAELTATMERVQRGDLDARPSLEGPSELTELAAALSAMTDSVADNTGKITQLEERSRVYAQRLRVLVDVGREITGSFSVRYIAEAVGGAAVSVSGFDCARVWVVAGDDASLSLVLDTSQPRDAAPAAEHVVLGEGLVGRTAEFGRPLSTAAEGGLAREHRGDAAVVELAVPMIVGGRVVGVIELRGTGEVLVMTDMLDVLVSLGGQAATAFEAARLNQQARELSQTDALTQLPNRRRFDADLAVEIARSVRYTRPLSLLMLDVDHFKTFNDERGHQAGDEILSELGTALGGSLRMTDTAYRFGGEEFCVLLRETDTHAAMEVGERLRASIAARFLTASGHAAVTISVGVASVSDHASTAAGLIAAADAAMYAAKGAGRNRVMSAGSPRARIVVDNKPVTEPAARRA